MFKNYLKIAYRNLLKTRIFSLINIFGLCIGMVSCLLILHYIHYEKSYDKYHQNNDRIFRLRYERSAEGGTFVRFASACPVAAPLIRERYPEVDLAARLFLYRAIVSFGDKKFIEEKMFFAESEIFKILTIPFIEGDPVKAIINANTAVISKSTAQKYFGDEPAIGKYISVDKEEDYLITGIFEDFPHNSHIKCDILLSYPNLVTLRGQELQQSWGHTGFYTYLLLKPGTDSQALENKFRTLIEEQAGEIMKHYGVVFFLKLQPLLDIHLTSHFMQELETNGHKDTVYYLSAIALFIIFMAWVNYVNLSTARSLTRAKEVGIRKSVGAQRFHLVLQFFTETTLLNFIAVFAAVILTELCLSLFHTLTGLPQSIHLVNQSWFWIVFVLLFLGEIVISGFYPVFLLTSFQPVNVLKGKPGTATKGIGLRKALVLFQFVIALILITGTYAVYRQIDFMRSQKLGFDKEQILVVKTPRIVSGSMEEKFNTFKDVAKQIRGVQKAAFVTEVPGRQIYWDAGAIHKKGTDLTTGRNYQIVGIDYDFVDVFDLKFVRGRNFSRAFPADKQAVLFNEKAVEWMGFEGPEAAVGQEIDYWGEFFKIIGVLKNYHQQSLKEEFEPHIYRFIPGNNRGHFALKIHDAKIKETVDSVHKLYAKLFPGNPFDFFFLNNYYNQQYQADELFGKVVGLFSLLAIIVTCLGIFGLSAFSTVQRTKEIGIRKAVGATVSNIMYLLTKDFMILLVLAFLISLPLTLFGINFWLSDFAHRMKLDSLLFLLPLITVWLIAIFTASTQAIRAAIANPVKSLRYE
jgi:putative ABC transport system permease protein